MKDEFHRLRLWEIEQREKAILFATMPDHSPRTRKVWIPRSVIDHISRDAALPNGWRPCTVDVADWFAEKEDL